MWDVGCKSEMWDVGGDVDSSAKVSGPCELQEVK